MRAMTVKQLYYRNLNLNLNRLINAIVLMLVLASTTLAQVPDSNTVLKGDIDLNGEVNFFDVSPFIAILSGGDFQAEADIDGNDLVDFLDIAPFIAILQGGSSSRPVVTSAATYPVIVEEDIVYANGLAHQNGMSTTTIEMPQMLDVYYPDNNSTNRPVFMFIHGGGFNGGTKTKPEIVNMANYFASRGWVFASVDYRTTSDLQGTDFTGMAPQEWIDFALQNAATPDDARRSIALYTAQRDAKAALRWIVANSSTYKINEDFITVGGASAGAITTIALGISNQEDFRDEIPLAVDPTLATTNLNETYVVRSLVDFWGGNIKLEAFESVYGIDRYDMNDPELFIAHGTLDPTVLFSEATELDSIYNSLGIYHEFVPLAGRGHGPWNATVDGKGLFEMSFDFLVDRQNLSVE